MVKQFLKVTWMLFWRSLVVVTVVSHATFPWYRPLAAAAFVAFFLVGGWRRTIETFPLIKLLRRINPIPRIDRYGDIEEPTPRAPHPTPVRIPPSSYIPPVAAPARPEAPTPAPVPQWAQGQLVPRASRRSLVPPPLDGASLSSGPVPTSPLMRGVPGGNLLDPEGGSGVLSAVNRSAGAAGEEQFAKALSLTPLSPRDGTVCHDGMSSILAKVPSAWSLSMPSLYGWTPDRKLHTDIDCVLFGANRVLLVDVKLYKSGDVTYRSDGTNRLFCIDNPTGDVVSPNGTDRWRTMSKNMEIAMDRFRGLADPLCTVNGLVVLMPTGSGSPTVDSSVKWPGNIPAVDVTTALAYIQDMFAPFTAATFPDQMVGQGLMSLLHTTPAASR